MFKQIMIAIALAFGLSAQAEILKDAQPTADSINGVTIVSAATLSVDGVDTKLATIGAGLRSKYKLFKWWPVYVGQFMMDKADKFVRTEEGALASTDAAAAMVMQMSFVRTVDGGDMSASFREGLVSNEADFKNPAIAEFLNAVTEMGAAVSGKAITVAGIRSAAGDVVVLENTASGKSHKITGAAGFVNKIFSIWLGNSEDGGVTKLKSDIVSGRMK